MPIVFVTSQPSRERFEAALQAVFALFLTGLAILAGISAAKAQEQTPFEIVRQSGHAHGISAVALSHDNKLALTGSPDGTIRLWDAASGRLLRAIQAHDAEGEDTSGVVSVTLSPNGRHVLSDDGGSSKLWDARTGRLVWTADGSGSRFSSTVAFSPDGRFLLSGRGLNFSDDDDTVLRIFDAATGEMLRSFKGSAGDISALDVSADGRRVLAGSLDGSLLLWEMDREKPAQSFKGHSQAIRSAAFSPDGSRVVSSSFDAGLSLWDAKSGQLLQRFPDHVEGSSLVAFLSDGRHVVSVGSQDNTLRVWDAESGKLLRAIEDAEAFNDHSRLALSRDGRTLFYGGQTLQLWDVESGQVVRTFDNNSSFVDAIAVTPDGGRILSAGREPGSVLTWDLSSGQLLRTLSAGQQSGFRFSRNFFSLSREGSRLLSTDFNGLRLSDPASSTWLRSFPGVAGALSPDGRRILASSTDEDDHVLRLWDADTGKRMRTLKGHTRRAHAIAFSPDGKRAISGGGDIALRLWDTASGKSLRSFQTHRRDREDGYISPAVTVVSFSPDGRHVAAGMVLNDGSPSLRLWNAASGKLLRSFQMPPRAHHYTDGDGVSAIAYSPDGRFLISGNDYSTALLMWDTSGGMLVRTFEGHSHGIAAVAFTPDGRKAISASYDGTIKIWRIESGELLVTLAEGKDGNWVALTPEGFFASSKDGAALLNVVRGLSVTTIDQVHQSLYNPDLIREKLAGDPLGEVRRASLVLDLEKVVASGPAPTVVIEPHEGGATSGTDLVTLKARIVDQGKGIGRIEWRINGVTAAVAGKPPVDGPEYVSTQEVALDPGDNVIEVVAYNAENLLASLPARTSIAYTGPADAVKPTLHILAIGINRYVDQGARDAETGHIAQFEPLDLAVKDAKAITESLKKAVGDRYETVNVKLALDEEATRDNLDAIVAGMAVDVHRRDTFVLFAAGHGYSSDGKFYLIPQDYSGGPEKAALEARAIGQERLQDWLANRIKAKRAVILLDTCESGALIAGHLRARAETAASEAGVGRLHEATGRSVLAAAALGQFAQEGLIASSGAQHGLFTYALLEALRDGDSNANGAIELSELVAHVQTRVPQLAADKGGTGRTIASSSVTDPGQQSARFGSRGEDFILVDRLR